MKYPQDRFPGDMPIRVLQNNIISHFESFRPEMVEEHKKAVEAGKVNPQINYLIERKPVSYPFANLDDRTINLPETFLSFLWATTFYFLTLNEECQKQMLLAQANGSVWNGQPDYADSLVDTAMKLGNWANHLRNGYSDWPSDLPSPETPDPKNPDNPDRELFEYVGKVNTVFLEALNYVMYHEYSHLILGHTGFPKNRKLTEEESVLSKLQESEADGGARDYTAPAHLPENLRFIPTFAQTMAAIALLHSIPDLHHSVGDTHPDIDNRVFSLLDNLDFSDEARDFGIKYLALLGFRTFFERIKDYLGSNGLDTKQTVYEDVDEALNDYRIRFDEFKAKLPSRGNKL